MTGNDPLAATFAFGDFELDWRSRELRKRGKRLRVAQQPLHALVLLVNAGGRVVTREDLRRALWEGGTFVDFDRAINKAIFSSLRGDVDDVAWVNSRGRDDERAFIRRSSSASSSTISCITV